MKRFSINVATFLFAGYAIGQAVQGLWLSAALFALLAVVLSLPYWRRGVQP